MHLQARCTFAPFAPSLGARTPADTPFNLLERGLPSMPGDQKSADRKKFCDYPIEKLDSPRMLGKRELEAGAPSFRLAVPNLASFGALLAGLSACSFKRRLSSNVGAAGECKRKFSLKTMI